MEDTACVDRNTKSTSSKEASPAAKAPSCSSGNAATDSRGREGLLELRGPGRAAAAVRRLRGGALLREAVPGAAQEVAPPQLSLHQDGETGGGLRQTVEEL